MPITQYTLQPQNLASYDVYIEDRSPNSQYFNVTNIPQKFTGGKNSFLIAGSEYLSYNSTLLIEILDSAGNPIYQRLIPEYIEGNSRLVSVEIYENTAPGFCTIIIMGQVDTTSDEEIIPPDWENKYNVRWVKQVLVDPLSKNTSKIVFEESPIILTEEKRFYSEATSSFIQENYLFTASLSPIFNSGIPVGYVIAAVSGSSFDAEDYNSTITGSIILNNSSGSVYLPITNILNSKLAFSQGYIIQLENGQFVNDIYLQNGKYKTRFLGTESSLTSSIFLNKLKLYKSQRPKTATSYAKIRIGKLNTVSGEIFKCVVYGKISTNISEYKILAEVPVITSDLLTTSSIVGELSIGNFSTTPSASNNWYADTLVKTTNVVYPISRSSAYTNYTSTVNPYTINVSDKVLLRSAYADVTLRLLPAEASASLFFGPTSESGYFIGNKQSVKLFPTTEYTLQFDAYYTNISGSRILVGKPSEVDIYLIGTNGTNIISDNPLGQKIGQLRLIKTDSTQQWFESKKFNFNPQLGDVGDVGIRFVITNGFWYFSNISLKPASDSLFSPDEVQILIPNVDYYNQFVTYKVKFLDINSNSTEVDVTSIPAFFTGSVIDMGTII